MPALLAILFALTTTTGIEEGWSSNDAALAFRDAIAHMQCFGCPPSLRGALSEELVLTILLELGADAVLVRWTFDLLLKPGSRFLTLATGTLRARDGAARLEVKGGLVYLRRHSSGRKSARWVCHFSDNQRQMIYDGRIGVLVLVLYYFGLGIIDVIFVKSQFFLLDSAGKWPAVEAPGPGEDEGEEGDECEATEGDEASFKRALRPRTEQVSPSNGAGTSASNGAEGEDEECWGEQKEEGEESKDEGEESKEEGEKGEEEGNESEEKGEDGEQDGEQGEEEGEEGDRAAGGEAGEGMTEVKEDDDNAGDLTEEAESRVRETYRLYGSTRWFADPQPLEMLDVTDITIADKFVDKINAKHKHCTGTSILEHFRVFTVGDLPHPD